MRYVWIIALLALSGCAGVQVGVGPQINLSDLRAEGDLQPIPVDAPSFERGF